MTSQSLLLWLLLLSVAMVTAEFESQYFPNEVVEVCITCDTWFALGGYGALGGYAALGGYGALGGYRALGGYGVLGGYGALSG